VTDRRGAIFTDLSEGVLVVRLFAGGIALMLVTGGGAWACQGQSSAAILDDTFKTPDPGWGPPDDAASFTAEGLVLKPPVNGSAWRWNPNYTIDGSDLCVSVINPIAPPGRTDIGDVGIWFWSQNAQNFYTATLALDGTVSIDRLVNGVWHAVMPPTPSGAVLTKPGQVNVIEVVVRGSAGTFFVNGTKIADFRGEPPPKGGPPGVYGESGSTGVTWVFPRVQLF
jgi:hypothetical protein